jgi:L-fucose mutarotase
MIQCSCLNPELLKSLALLGHGDKILISDGNYAISSNIGSEAKIVDLRLTNGIPLVTDVLRVLCNLIPIEKAQVMKTPTGQLPKIYNEFKCILCENNTLEKNDRFKFYNECKESNVKLEIATGEPRLCANILLTVGFNGEFEYL